jgi:hypothetical protein
MLVQVEIWMSTCEFSSTWAPAGGSWDCTVPGSMQLLMSDVLAVRPALLSACAAEDCLSPRRAGTVVWPSETASCTGEPAGSMVPPGEF